MPEIIKYKTKSYPVVDIYGHALEVSTPVRYGGTGTSGYIMEITCDSEGPWAVIDSTGLMYKLETLTFLDEYEAKEVMGERWFTREEIKEVLQKAQEEADRAKLDDTNVETGG